MGKRDFKFWKGDFWGVWRKKAYKFCLLRDRMDAVNLLSNTDLSSYHSFLNLGGLLAELDVTPAKGEERKYE